MDTKKKLTKKEKKEAHRTGQLSQEIVSLIASAFQKDPTHEFNRTGLLQDRKSEYWPDDYESLTQIQNEKTVRATETVHKAGPTVMAHVMRHYCEVMADPNRTQAESSAAMLDAIHLLFIIAKLGKRDTDQLNNAIIDTCARNATMQSLDDIVYHQWQGRQKYYTPELRAQMLKDLKVRTIA